MPIKKCIRCGDEFKVSKEDQELASEGYISWSDIRTCYECSGNSPEQDYSTPSDADPGL